MSAQPRRRVPREMTKGQVNASLGERVRQLRTQRGLTQAQLAGADFTKAFISQVENGHTSVSVRAAGILARRLNVDTGELLAPASESDLQQELALVLAEGQLQRGEAAVALKAVRALRVSGERHRARSRRLQGLAELALGQPRRALEPLRDSIRRFARTDLAESATRTMYDLGYAYASLDQPGEALGLLMEVERRLVAAELVDRTLELKVHALLAGIFVRMGDWASADLQAERAERIAEDVTDVRSLDTLYASLVALRREQGDLEGALTYARKAVQLHEQVGRDTDVLFAWNNLAWLYIEREQFKRAQEALEKAEGLRRQRGDESLGHLAVTRAKLELARGNARAALSLARTAADDARLQRTSRAQAQFIVARATAELGQNLKQVRASFAAALSAYESEPSRRRARVHEAFARVLADAGATADAYAEARRALELYERHPENAGP